MTIDKLDLPPAQGISYSGGNVSYWTPDDPVYSGKATDSPYPYMGADNRPLRNLAWRDNLIADKVDILIDAINPFDPDGCKPYASDPADNDLNISAGKYVTSNGEIIMVADQSVGPFDTVSTGYERYDLIVIDKSGTAYIMAGEEIVSGSGDPYVDAPYVPTAVFAIGIIKIDEDSTLPIIEEDDITDIRRIIDRNSTDNVSTSIYQIGHGFSVGNVIRYNGSAYVKAKSDTLLNSQAIGIVNNVVEDNFSFISAGKIEGLSGLTPGSLYYLSASTAGLLTVTVPSSGNIRKPMLVAISTTSGFVIPTIMLPHLTSLNGLSGDINIIAGTDIGVSVGANSVTINNTKTSLDSLNGLTGAVNIVAGVGITRTVIGSSITITNSRKINGLTDDVNVIAGTGINISAGSGNIQVTNDRTINGMVDDVNIIAGTGIGISAGGGNVQIDNTREINGIVGDFDIVGGSDISVSVVGGDIVIANSSTAAVTSVNGGGGAINILPGDDIDIQTVGSNITINSTKKENYQLDLMCNTAISVVDTTFWKTANGGTSFRYYQSAAKVIEAYAFCASPDTGASQPTVDILFGGVSCLTSPITLSASPDTPVVGAVDSAHQNIASGTVIELSVTTGTNANANNLHVALVFEEL